MPSEDKPKKVEKGILMRGELSQLIGKHLNSEVNITAISLCGLRKPLHRGDSLSILFDFEPLGDNIE